MPPLQSERFCIIPMGNQITNSEISVLSNGIVMQRNRIQATLIYQPSLTLSGSDLKKLLTAIEASLLMENTYKEEGQTSFGSSSGELTVYGAKGIFDYVKAVARNEGNEGELNKGVEKLDTQSQWILTLINNLAKNKIK